MIIQRLFSEKGKKDKKKAKIATGLAFGSIAGSVGADALAADHETKADKIIAKHHQNLDKRGKRIAKKVGVTNNLGTFLFGKNPEAVKKGEEMAKRHDRIVKGAAEKHIKAAEKLGKTGKALTAVGIGSGLYALKKQGDAKKAEKEEKKES